MQASDFQQLIQQKEILNLLDVRTPSEFEDFNFGGINISMDELFGRLSEIQHLKTEAFVIICGTGLLSNIAVKVLKSRGFPQAENLEGGLEAYLSL
jgi:rhodanese-related sulfurtransferase